MLFRKELVLKMKNIESIRIGLFYLALSAEFSSEILTTKYFVSPVFFLTIHGRMVLITFTTSAAVKECTEKFYAV